MKRASSRTSAADEVALDASAPRMRRAPMRRRMRCPIPSACQRVAGADAAADAWHAEASRRRDAARRIRASAPMSLDGVNLHLCSCNGTMPLDREALARALELSGTPAIRLDARARKELSAFAAPSVRRCRRRVHAGGQALRRRRGGGRHARRRSASSTSAKRRGWSAEARQATPKIAALLALAGLPDPDPVPRVTYRSQGQLLIVGPGGGRAALGGRAVRATRRSPSVVTRTQRRRGAARGAQVPRPFRQGREARRLARRASRSRGSRKIRSISILCTRCNACIRVCPEQAIDWSYQIDLDRCKAHRKCVAACGATARDRLRASDTARAERFDLVLDLQAAPALAHAPAAAGLLRAGRRSAWRRLSGGRARDDDRRVREAEVLRVQGVDLRARAVAERSAARNASTSARREAIRADGDGVVVEPQLCMGCGACATGVPVGRDDATRYPSVSDLGRRDADAAGDLREERAVATRALLLHAEDGRAAIARLRAARPRIAGARDPARSPSRRVDRPRRLAGGARARREPGRRDAARRHGGAAISRRACTRRWRSPTRSRRRWATRAAFPAVRWRRHAGVRCGVVVVAGRASGARRGHVRVHQRQADDRGARDRAPRAARAGAAARDRAAPGVAVRHDRRSITTRARCASRASARCPEGAILDNTRRRRSSASSRRSACSAGSARRPARSTRSRCRRALNLAAEAKQPRVVNEAAVFKCIACGKPLGPRR